MQMELRAQRHTSGEAPWAQESGFSKKGHIPCDIPTGQSGAVGEGMLQTLGH